MDRGLRAQLSPNEEATLQRISLGLDQKDLRPELAERLKLLELVEERDRKFVVTALGARRIVLRPDSSSA